MKLIKIDPNTQSIEYVESTGKLNCLRNLIECRMIDVCARQDNGDSLTVDDEALFQEPQPFAFRFGDYGQPIHGIALLTGVDEEGRTAEPTMTLEQAQDCIKWMGNVYTRPSFSVVPLYDRVLIPGMYPN